MKDRILQFLESEKISPAEFADKIGVQRSSMSHILNGRNYPSASFIQKMLQAYPLVNSRWLMIGDGMMNEGSQELKEIPLVSPQVLPGAGKDPGITLQDDNPAEYVSLSASESAKDLSAAVDESHVSEDQKSTGSKVEKPKEFQVTVNPEESIKERHVTNPVSPLGTVFQDEKEIEQVLFFFKDKTFRIYRPS